MTVQFVGSRIGCFDCCQYKEQLKGLGFTWYSKKRAWVWHSEPYHRHHKQGTALQNMVEEMYQELPERKPKKKKAEIVGNQSVDNDVNWVFFIYKQNNYTKKRINRS